MDHIERAAGLLKNGESVIFYSAAGGTFLNVRELKVRFGLTPSAICDKDPNKQGRSWKGLEGVEVVSPEEAMRRFERAWWYITSSNNLAQIIGYLTQECGIPPERVLNYMPVHKIRSCKYIQESVYFCYTGEMTFCCERRRPLTAPSKELDIDAFLTLRDGLLSAIEEDRLPADSPCAGCAQIKTDYYPVTPKGRIFNYFGGNTCNYRCCYCGLDHASTVTDSSVQHAPYELVEALRQRGGLNEHYEMDFTTAGEPTIYPKRKEVYRTFDGENFEVLTNGFLFDPDLFELMGRQKTLIVDSIDAGTRETYRRIKGVDGFDRVRENLKKYAQAPLCVVVAKYIFMPGDNDTPEEADGFVDFCVAADVSYAIITVEYDSMPKVTAHTEAMIQRVVSGLREHDILCIPVGSWVAADYADKLSSLVSLENHKDSVG